jgi:PhnB protein
LPGPAQLVERMTRLDGTLGHGEVRIGDSVAMMGEPPDPARARPTDLYVYVSDVDATHVAGDLAEASMTPPWHPRLDDCVRHNGPQFAAGPR